MGPPHLGDVLGDLLGSRLERLRLHLAEQQDDAVVADDHYVGGVEVGVRPANLPLHDFLERFIVQLDAGRAHPWVAGEGGAGGQCQAQGPSQ